MSFLTKGQKKKIPTLYAQEEIEDPIVYMKISILNSWWLITELDSEKELAFGFACIGENYQSAELGYVSLEELEELRHYGIKIEEVERPLSEMKKELGV